MICFEFVGIEKDGAQSTVTSKVLITDELIWTSPEKMVMRNCDVCAEAGYLSQASR